MRKSILCLGILWVRIVLSASLATSLGEDLMETTVSFDTENGLDLEDGLGCDGDCQGNMLHRTAKSDHNVSDGSMSGFVTDVRVEQKLMNTTQQIAIVSWNPPPGSASRQYEVIVQWRRRNESAIRTTLCKQYQYDKNECELSSLEFGTKYFVEIRSVLDGVASDQRAKVEFATLSKEQTCLEYTGYNLTICPPETPVGLTSKEIRLGDRHVNGTLHDVIATWTPSKHPPALYIARFRTWVNDTQIGKDLYRNVTGNETSTTFSSVLVGFSFQLSVSAYSQGGLSGWADISRQLDETEPEPLTTQLIGGINVTVLVVIMTSLIIFTLVSGTGLLINRLCTKRKRYEERCRYFQSLDQKSPVLQGTSIGSNVQVMVPVNDKWEIPFDSLLQGDVLGEGAFGVVRKGLLEGHTQDKQPLLEVAVKMVRDDPTVDELRQFLQEIEMMKSLGQHQNIVSIIGCCTHSPKILLVTEYCALGDLQRYLRKEWDRLYNSKQESQEAVISSKTSARVKYAELALSTEGSGVDWPTEDVGTPTNKKKATMFVNQMYDIENYAGDRHPKCNGRLTSNDLLSFARQITVGMEFLSGNRIVHRDLAARNVLVCADRKVKISDFGLSRDLYEQNVYRKKCMGKLPIRWMAIESLLHQVFTTHSDVWSFGVLLWEIVTLGGNPYPCTQTDSLFKLLRAGYRMERPANCSIEIYNIMIQCWEANPRDRPTFTHLRKQLDTLLEGSIGDQYLNLDLLLANDSPQTSTSTVEQQSSSTSSRSPGQLSSEGLTAPAYNAQSVSDMKQ